MSLLNSSYDPALEPEIRHVFGDVYGPFPTALHGPSAFANSDNVVSDSLFRPNMDLRESDSDDDHHVTATFELPGLNPEDVEVDVSNDCLTVSGEGGSSAEHREEGYSSRQQTYGKFSRTLPLPAGTKPEDVKTAMQNGILKVTFPRNDQASQDAIRDLKKMSHVAAQ
ncbi:hypothetical protein BOTBODRAFT_33554 [Botryobasidium botryosum FD-172 SS1]|uniref:SHSP domain-containing protein n=1 Tax=Botryobasidium botryosum (strain FD-172 SS1) TaxID=930990 RepID=A0A067MPM8_BOTB1|nr:hypothetical protein BOTBODRAFT_33554 [Botryobasidium botryosum FD-172 SS1]